MKHGHNGQILFSFKVFIREFGETKTFLKMSALKFDRNSVEMKVLSENSVGVA